MKLRSALAILALLAVAVLPVAAAPAVVTGDIYAETITNGTDWNFYAAYDVYVNAAMDDWASATLTLARSLQNFIYYKNVTDQTVLASATTTSVFENAYVSAAVGTINVAKFFGLDKMLIGTLKGGYGGTSPGTYENKDMMDSWVRLRQRITNPNWFLEANVGLPGLVTVKFGIAPVAFSTSNNASYSFSNDWSVFAQTSQALGTAVAFDAEAGYYMNKKTDIAKGIVFVDGDSVITMGLLKATVGLGIEYDLNASSFTYGLTGRGTYYLDEKKTTFAGLGLGLKGVPTATTTAAAFSKIEIDLFVTPIALIDLKSCILVDLSQAVNVIRTFDTAAQINFGTATDLVLGYLYCTAADSTFVDTQMGTNNSTAPVYGGGPYVKLFFAF